ncbi:MAG TPA: hypothetical protein V6C52_12625, partial [Coleofasciculaceae cyanobacterium]
MRIFNRPGKGTPTTPPDEKKNQKNVSWPRILTLVGGLTAAGGMANKDYLAQQYHELTSKPNTALEEKHNLMAMLDQSTALAKVAKAKQDKINTIPIDANALKQLIQDNKIRDLHVPTNNQGAWLIETATGQQRIFYPTSEQEMSTLAQLLANATNPLDPKNVGLQDPTMELVKELSKFVSVNAKAKDPFTQTITGQVKNLVETNTPLLDLNNLTPKQAQEIDASLAKFIQDQIYPSLRPDENDSSELKSNKAAALAFLNKKFEAFNKVLEPLTPKVPKGTPVPPPSAEAVNKFVQLLQDMVTTGITEIEAANPKYQDDKGNTYQGADSGNIDPEKLAVLNYIKDKIFIPLQGVLDKEAFNKPDFEHAKGYLVATGLVDLINKSDPTTPEGRAAKTRLMEVLNLITTRVGVHVYQETVPSGEGAVNPKPTQETPGEAPGQSPGWGDVLASPTGVMMGFQVLFAFIFGYSALHGRSSAAKSQKLTRKMVEYNKNKLEKPSANMQPLMRPQERLNDI